MSIEEIEEMSSDVIEAADAAIVKMTDAELDEIVGGRQVYSSTTCKNDAWAKYFKSNGTVLYRTGGEDIECYVRRFWWNNGTKKFTRFTLQAVRDGRIYNEVHASNVVLNCK